MPSQKLYNNEINYEDKEKNKKDIFGHKKIYYVEVFRSMMNEDHWDRHFKHMEQMRNAREKTN
jgi:hypothetical protein